MSDFPFADILFLAAIAIFIGLRLRNTLGKDVGFDPREAAATRAAQAAEAAQRVETATMKDVTPVIEDEAADSLSEGELAENIKAIKAIDQQFSLTNFKHGARTAFEWIFEAYQKGDKDALKPLLATDIYVAFAAAIDERNAAGHVSGSTLVKVHEVEVLSAVLQNKIARLTVRFASEQVHVTRDAEGQVVEGSANEFIRVNDEWVFERDLTSKSPNWTVMDT